MENKRSIEKVILSALIITSLILIGDLFMIMLTSNIETSFKALACLMFGTYTIATGAVLAKILKF